MGLFKMIKKMFTGKPHEISKEEMVGKINEIQDRFGIPEDEVPWAEFQDDTPVKGVDDEAEK